MKTLLSLSLLLSINSAVLSNECNTNPHLAHTHDTHNVSHQFYDALVETPKDAIVKGAVATKDLTKTVAAAVVFSNAAHELKDAAKELVIDTTIKTAHAIKNGAIKTYDSTKEGAKVVYNNAVVKPAHAINHAAHAVADSDFVQGSKETAEEVGAQFKEVGQDMWSATKTGIKRAYHILVEKPVGAVKAAGHYLAHGDEQLITPVINTIAREKFVMIHEHPVALQADLECDHHVINPGVAVPQTHASFTTISVMSPALAQEILPGVYVEGNDSVDPKLKLEYLLRLDNITNSNKALSDSTLKLLSQAYDSVASDLCLQ
jgi:hypothetical protein